MKGERSRTRLWWTSLLVVVVLAVGLRVAYAARTPDRLVGDGVIYDRLASQLLDHGYLGYSVDSLRSWRPPLYPTMIAGAYAALGRRPLTAKVVDAVLAGLVALVVCLLGRRLGAPWAGVIGALLFALHGYEIRHATRVYPDTLAALLVVLFVLPGGRILPLRSFLRGLLAGLLLLVQPALITVPVLTGAVIVILRTGPRPKLSAALLVLGTLVAIVPWTIRNYRVHGTFVYISTNGGFNMMKGVNDPATGGPRTSEGREWYKVSPPGLTEVERDRRHRGIALDWIRDNPGTAILLALKRARAWFLPASLSPPTRWPVQHLTIFPLAVLGAIVLLGRRVGGLPVIMAILAGAVPSVLITYVGPRYRSPVVPLICLLAGFGAVAILSRLRRRTGPAATDSGAR